MAKHNETGKEGEIMGAGWLEKQGFTILHQNWRFYLYEIDIIATRDNILHFIEVKTRKSYAFGYPEESVSGKKMANMKKCAEKFQELFPEWQRIQYDILSINLTGDKPPQFFLIEDMY